MEENLPSAEKLRYSREKLKSYSTATADGSVIYSDILKLFTVQ